MSTTLTGTVTVNAAFLQEIKEDNRELHRLLRRASAIVTESAVSVRPRALFGILESLRDQLSLHFSLEEAYGYFEDAVSVAPQLCDTAEELRREHIELFTSICDMLEEAEQLLYHEASIACLHGVTAEFADWYRRLKRHEQREADLIFSALNDDIGVGD